MFKLQQIYYRTVKRAKITNSFNCHREKVLHIIPLYIKYIYLRIGLHADWKLPAIGARHLLDLGAPQQHAQLSQRGHIVRGPASTQNSTDPYLTSIDLPENYQARMLSRYCSYKFNCTNNN